MRKYFIAGDKLFCFNAKCCTSSFTRSIIEAHHPDIWYNLNHKIHFSYGKTVHEIEQLHKYAPMRVNPDRPAALLMRDPVARFRSAAGFLRISNCIDEVLDIMINETGAAIKNDKGILFGARKPVAADIHMLKQSRFLHDDHVEDIKIFKMPDQIDECAEWLGLPTPMVHKNETSGPKPNLTAEQIEKIKHYYRKDIELWESL
jgi:hypothetical protein